ncbi:hypothetical protein BH11VER1_BH11VER1_35990 [soil metagenome]
MKVELFTICDAATNDGGKLSLLGTFDTIRGEKAPTVCRAFAIAGRVRFTRIEEGEHRFKVTVTDEDGGPVIPPLDFRVVIEVPEEQFSAVHCFVVNLQGIQLKSFGEYQIDLAIDNRQESTVPLYLVRNTPLN